MEDVELAILVLQNLPEIIKVGEGIASAVRTDLAALFDGIFSGQSADASVKQRLTDAANLAAARKIANDNNSERPGAVPAD